MSFPQTNFASILDGYGVFAGVGFDETTGNRAPTLADKGECASLLNEVLEELWAGRDIAYLMLPSMTTKATVTVRDGVISWADLAYSAKWSLWTTDPEASWAARDGLYETYLRRGVLAGSGVLVQNAGATMVAYYLKARPLFTHVAWVTGTSYAAGDRVLSDKDCYVCATAHVAGTFATDLAASKWTVQTLAAELRQPVLRRMQERRSSDVENRPVKGGFDENRALAEVDNMYLRIARSGPDWYRHNGGLSGE